MIVGLASRGSLPQLRLQEGEPLSSSLQAAAYRLHQWASVSPTTWLLVDREGQWASSPCRMRALSTDPAPNGQ